MESKNQQTPGHWPVDKAEPAEKQGGDDMAARFAHIKGWGIDADAENEPTYPMKHWNGDDRKGLNYDRPELQPVTVEKLHSIERPSVSAVFGTTCPPTGVSGALRRHAFKYSEGKWAHWLTLLVADRVNAVEGIIDDIKQGIFPNIIAERGWTAEWKYNRKGMVKNIAIGVAVTAAVLMLLSGRNKKAH
ncbi:hypothetical protein [Longitalea luteola]|uniref:hypothetical protein n=1 Tax=Longitalea luteola TaxID=2812563 RepID=UPI001F618261|nr:hypothetical protein [Longitalea luteola]